jgi:hypothetical protein
MRARAIAAVVVSVLVLPAAAQAEEARSSRRAVDARERDRPHTAAEVTSGVLLLPGALVCPQTGDQATCKRGEFSLAAGLQNIYRFGAFGVGAGILWAHTLRSDAANGDPTLMREHSRSYFLVEALARYYFLKSRRWDFWAGLTVGLVVLNDTWTVAADRTNYEMTAQIGPQTGTLGTEGFTAGAAAGAEWTFLPNWSFGPALRYSNWLLPNTRKVSPTLDVASLAGRLDIIDVAVRVTYRISL